MQPAIESHGLVKRFGAQEAVAGVDITVPAGAVYGFLGPNGAGKTTTIRMALGLIRPNAGTISVFGHDVARDRMKTAAMIGSMVESPALYDKLTGRENLNVARRLLGKTNADVDRVLETVGMTYARKRLAGGYSQGMRQRLGIARALLGSPKLLILDEPTNGLDPEGIREIRDLIRTAPEREGVTVFVSSHMLSEVEQMATHVGVMLKGKLWAQGPLAELKGAGPRWAEVGVNDPAGAAGLLTASGLTVEMDGAALMRVALPPGEDGPRGVAAINRKLVEAGFEVFSINLPTRSLEDVYLAATADLRQSEPGRKGAAR